MLTRRQLFSALAVLPFIGRFVPTPLDADKVARWFNVHARLITPTVGMNEYTREEFDVIRLHQRAMMDAIMTRTDKEFGG